ncbi:hypothetical protein MRX96_013933 [Rhipicephalus microplus]
MPLARGRLLPKILGHVHQQAPSVAQEKLCARNVSSAVGLPHMAWRRASANTTNSLAPTENGTESNSRAKVTPIRYAGHVTSRRPPARRLRFYPFSKAPATLHRAVVIRGAEACPIRLRPVRISRRPLRMAGMPGSSKLQE